jgi:hypothetical protein
MISTIKNWFKPRYNFPPPEAPIYLFCYHKVGTILLAKVFRELCQQFGWRFKTVIGKAKEVPTDADIVLFMHSLVDLGAVKHGYLGAHFTRDPRDVIVSGYLYHKRCSEDWCVNESPDATEPILFPNVPWSQQHRPESWKAAYIESLNNISYQQNLLDRDQGEGIHFEMHNYAAWTIDSMLDWDYANPRVLEVQFEALMGEFDTTFAQMFEFFGFSDIQIKHGLRIAKKEDLGRKSDRQLRANKHISSRQTTKWQRYFETSHKEAFEKRFEGALAKLGYAEGDSW